MARTPQEELDDVDAKKKALEEGLQSSTVDDNQYNEINYRELRAEQKEARRRLHRSKGGWTRKWQ